MNNEPQNNAEITSKKVEEIIEFPNILSKAVEEGKNIPGSRDLNFLNSY